MKTAPSAWEGATVAATVSEENMEFARLLGAREVINYRKSKFEEEIQDADLVLDLVGGDTFQRSFGALKEGPVSHGSNQFRVDR